MAESDIDETDPVVTTYQVYIKPRSNDDREIYILQYPNRNVDQPYSKTNESAPLKFRTKPASGMAEIDVPIDEFNNYDKVKGVQYGLALKKSAASKGQGSHGLPGGFGIGGATTRGRGKGRTEDEETEAFRQIAAGDFGNAVQSGKVLSKQTLGGQMVTSDGTNPQYLVGTFRHDQLHLTPVDHIVQMRPQFHHIDALAEQKKSSLPQAPVATGTAGARAITMTVKSTVDGEESTTDTMAKRISNTQKEPWIQHRYTDEEVEEAWGVFEDNFYAGPKEDLSHEELLKDLPKLQSSLDNGEYLDVISAPTDESRLSRSKKFKKGKRDLKGKGREGEVKNEGDLSGLSDEDTSTALPDIMEVDS